MVNFMFHRQLISRCMFESIHYQYYNTYIISFSLLFVSVNNIYIVKSEKDLVERGHWDKMSQAFNELYETQLSQITQEIDREEFGQRHFV